MGCKVLENEKMSKHTSFKIGGPADLFIYINSVQSLKEILKFIKSENLPFYILGNGTNLLVADDGFRGVVLNLQKSEKVLKITNDNIVECSAGIQLAKACVFAMEHGLSGLEFAWGIPGTCGGAVYMNAGAYGNDISDVIIEATHMTPEGETVTLKKDELNFGYRTSYYKDKNLIITSMKLKLTPSNKPDVKAKMYENILKRKSKQPLNHPNAGSTFKRPGNGYYAGTLIQDSGLKGTAVGGAMVSTKHAGFIVNTGKATANDVVNLIKLVKETVQKASGILLECEIKTLGNINLK